jgi:dihydroneopterin aldolase
MTVTMGPTQVRLVIDGVELRGFHGLLESERRKGSRFCIDLEVDVKLHNALETDRVEDTVDYRKIVETVREVNRSRRYSLVEVFANAVADAVFARFQKVQRIRVRLRKLEPPGVGRVHSVAAEVVKERG